MFVTDRKIFPPTYIFLFHHFTLHYEAYAKILQCNMLLCVYLCVFVVYLLESSHIVCLTLLLYTWSSSCYKP